MSNKKDKKTNLPKISDKLNRRKVSRHLRKIERSTTRHARRFILKRWTNVIEVRRNIITWILIVALLIGATGLQLMWFRNSYRTTTTATNSTYVEGVLGEIDNLNPLFATTSAEKSLSRLLFSSLMSYDTKGKLNYDLASSVTIDGSGTIYTIKIRPNVKWSDGQPVTAKDISFTLGLMQDRKVRSALSGWDSVKVRAVDDATIELTTRSPYSAFKHALTFAVLPEHLLGKVNPAQLRENNFSQNPVGSGPFKLNFVQNVEATTGEKVIYLTRNNNYYRGVAKISNFQLHAYATTNDIIEALANNEVSAATDLSPVDMRQIDKSKYNLLSVPIQGGVYAILNTKSSILSDNKVRKALQLATNTTAIMDKLPVDVPELYLPITPINLDGNSPTAPGFNLELAKSLLDEAGWTMSSDGVRQKDDKVLQLTIATAKSNEYEDDLEVLSGQWRSLGIVVNTQVADTDGVVQNIIKDVIQPRNYDVLLYRLDIGGDPDVYAYWHSSQISTEGLNLSNYSSAVSDDVLATARLTFDMTLRKAKYMTFVNQWLSDVPAIGLYQSTMQYVVNKNVVALSPDDTLVSGIDRYSDVLNWSGNLETVYKTP